MTKNSRSTLISELHDTKQALQASERRARRAVKRLRDLEKAMSPVLERVSFWAETPLPDDANAAKVLTVGQCRRLRLLLSGDVNSEPEELEPAESQAC